MIRIVCPACEDEKEKFELVNVVPQKRKYTVRCPDCGKLFVVYGEDQPDEPSKEPDPPHKS